MHILERISHISWLRISPLITDLECSSHFDILLSQHDMRSEAEFSSRYLIVELDATSDSYSVLKMSEIAAGDSRVGAFTVIQNGTSVELFDTLGARSYLSGVYTNPSIQLDLNDPKSFDIVLRKATNAIWRAVRVEGFECKVAGVTFHKEAVSLVKVEDEVSIVPEPDNKFDKNAIAFIHQGRRIGYVAKSDQDIFQYLLQEDGPEFEAVVNWVGSPKGNQDITALSISVTIK